MNTFTQAFLDELEKLGFKLSDLKAKLYPNPAIKQDLKGVQEGIASHKQEIRDLTRIMNEHAQRLRTSDDPAHHRSMMSDAEYYRDKALSNVSALRNKAKDLSGKLSRVRRNQALALGGLALGGIGTGLAIHAWRKRRAARRQAQKAQEEESGQQKEAGLRDILGSVASKFKDISKKTPWALSRHAKGLQSQLQAREGDIQKMRSAASTLGAEAAKDIHKHKNILIKINKPLKMQLIERLQNLRSSNLLEGRSPHVSKTFRRRRLNKLEKAITKRIATAESTPTRIRLPKALYEAFQRRQAAKDMASKADVMSQELSGLRSSAAQAQEAAKRSKSTAAKVALGAGGAALLTGAGIMAYRAWKRRKKEREEENQPQYKALEEWRKM